ncbi:MAG: hypothetical protein HZA90_23380 [Verrucomicrobia bacterium]|nr:hypothetical protein [Verrucomicrobiota bacterium]
MSDPTSNTVPGEIFEQHRSQLQALAYRLLGTVSDAEDIVQDANLRWMASHTRLHQASARHTG